MIEACGFHRHPADGPRELAISSLVPGDARRDRRGDDRPADPPADRPSGHPGSAPDGYDDQPYFRTMPRLILLEMGCHLVDTARFLIGEIQTVSATLGRFGRNSIGEDVATLSLYFAGRLPGSARHDLVRRRRSRPVRNGPSTRRWPKGLPGRSACLPTARSNGSARPAAASAEPCSLPDDDQVYVDGYVATQRHFIAGLLSGTEHETRASDTLRTMDVIWTAYRSAEEGRVLAV